jgi:EAL domain-containing protein (putative c-di-GMP-specific phosphodiesterase class I)
VKIDRGFIADLASGRDAAGALVRTIASLGHDFGLTVVAEGIEDGDTRDVVAALGCDVAQGYFFARPMPAPKLAEWLATRTTLTAQTGTTRPLPVINC